MDLPTLVIIPVLLRPKNVEAVLGSLRANTPEPHRVLFVANRGDVTELAAIAEAGAEVLIMPYGHHPARWRNRPGEWARKINTAYAQSDEPLLFLGADDVVFHPGWLSAAQRKLTRGIGVVGTNDLHNARVLAGSHATHLLVTREYVDRYGTIDERGKVLCEEYPHEYVDQELVQTAMSRRAYAHAHDSLVEATHPLWGNAPSDGLYRQHAARMRAGRVVYLSRRPLWT